MPSPAQLKVWGIGLLAILLFSLGYETCHWFMKPETHTITKFITVTMGKPDQTPTAPVVDHGVVNPGTHYVETKDQPKPPASSIPALDKPDQTTVITVQVPTAMKLQVFHQSELKWSRNGDNYSIWDEGRIWTLDEKGQPLEGITADTAYSKDASLSLPVSFAYSCPKERPWAAGGILNLTPKGYGVFLDRDFSILRFGVEAVKITAPVAGNPSWNTSIKVGARF